MVVCVCVCDSAMLMWMRRLCEESEKTSGSGTDQTDLDGERASSAVAVNIAGASRVAAAAASGACVRGRGGLRRAGSGGASRSGAVVSDGVGRGND
jgi:hypothetical protein